MIPPGLLPDLYLIYKIQRGDRDAFSTLYKRHVRRVFGLLYRLSGSIEVAEDLTQETFLSAYRSLSTYQSRSSFSTWICAIALHTHRDYYRFAKRLPETEPLEDIDAIVGREDENPLAVCTQREASKALEQAIQQLPDAAREAFILVRVEGLSYQDAADHLGIPLGTVQSRLHRATQLLHRALAHLIYDGDKLKPLPATKEASHVIQ